MVFPLFFIGWMKLPLSWVSVVMLVDAVNWNVPKIARVLRIFISKYCHINFLRQKLCEFHNIWSLTITSSPDTLDDMTNICKQKTRQTSSYTLIEDTLKEDKKTLNGHTLSQPCQLSPESWRPKKGWKEGREQKTDWHRRTMPICVAAT